jgi:hypothetical protein
MEKVPPFQAKWILPEFTKLEKGWAFEKVTAIFFGN